MQKYTVTIEALKRATVEVEAKDKDEAITKVQRRLMDEGASFIPFEEMYDSIQTTAVKES